MRMRQTESGNVFVYIFICIALLAALSYAIAQGGRSSVTSLSDERRRLVATDIIGYSDTLAKAVTQLRLRGVAATDLSFANPFLSATEYGDYNDDPANAPNEIFNPVGGAVIYQPPPSEATNSAQHYMFLAGNEVVGIGTTCGNDNCADLLMAIADMRQDVCIEINDLLGVPNPSGVPPEDDAIDDTIKFKPGDGFGFDETIGDDDSTLESRIEACFTETDPDPDEYVYYRVLLPR